MRHPRISIAVVGIVAALAIASLAADAPQKPEHPVDTAGSLNCIECHKDETPQVYTDWYDGDHGLNNVKCVVCHGSAGADFVITPDASRCVACHADQVVPITDGPLAGKSCFDCHSSHRLDPHGM